MKEYHKINTLYKRDPNTNRIIIGDYAAPELEYLALNDWVFTEKIDGTNIRIMWDGVDPDLPDRDDIRFGGKTDKAQIPQELLWWLQDNIEHIRLNETFGPAGNVCLYGEGYGAGIQKGGGNYSPAQKFILFDVKIGHWWLERHNVEDIAEKLNLDVVPIIMRGTLEDAVIAVEGGIKSTFGDFLAEGLVGTPAIPLFTRKGDRIITKIKHRDFHYK